MSDPRYRIDRPAGAPPKTVLAALRGELDRLPSPPSESAATFHPAGCTSADAV